MPARQQFLEDMSGDDRHAAILVAQVGGMPTELQLIVQTSEYISGEGGLKPLRTFIIRVNGVIEHRVVNLGMTAGDVQLTGDHPLLWQYTEKPAGVFFRGTPEDPHALGLALSQVYLDVFDMWRTFPNYINTSQPLNELLTSGGGLLGQMPRPLADKVVPLLERHGLETKVIYDESYIERAEGPMREQEMLALIFDDSYFISQMFTFELMRQREKRSPTG